VYSNRAIVEGGGLISHGPLIYFQAALLAGLSPAGMAASLAALVRPCFCPVAIEADKGAKNEEHVMSPPIDAGFGRCLPICHWKTAVG
jgi:hypothetical protein